MSSLGGRWRGLGLSSRVLPLAAGIFRIDRAFELGEKRFY